MWLSGLHIPESYLTALVQATCRKNSWPLDKSTLYTTVTKYTDPDDVTDRATSGAWPLVGPNTFRTPVYVTSMRRNAMGVGLVFEADLFTKEHISHWVLQGLCLILNTD
uniref:Dynein heavy chain C-terminal domain-containing protein n=1 Tax=Biomphalaria glabrata TaxID=6526 RepID=A0A2C9KDW1_BIOGL